MFCFGFQCQVLTVLIIGTLVSMELEWQDNNHRASSIPLFHHFPHLHFQPPPGACTRAQLGNQMKWEFLTSCNLSSNRVTKCNLKTCFEVCIWVVQCAQKVDVFQKCTLASTHLHSELFTVFTHMRQEAYCVNL